MSFFFDVEVWFFKKQITVSSENGLKLYSTLSRGRFTSSIFPFYKYYAPLEQETINRSG